MIAKLIAAFTRRDTTKLLLAGLAVSWGVASITQLAEAMQAEADALDAELAAKADKLAQLDALLAERVAQVTDEMPPAPGQFEPARPTPPPFTFPGSYASSGQTATPDDLDAWAAERADALKSVCDVCGEDFGPFVYCPNDHRMILAKRAAAKVAATP